MEFEGTGVQVPCPPGAFVDLSSIEGTFPDDVRHALLFDILCWSTVTDNCVQDILVVIHIAC